MPAWHERSTRREGAGVRKPPKKEPAGSRWAVSRLWGFGSAATLPGGGFLKIAEPKAADDCELVAGAVFDELIGKWSVVLCRRLSTLG